MDVPFSLPTIRKNWKHKKDDATCEGLRNYLMFNEVSMNFQGISHLGISPLQWPQNRNTKITLRSSQFPFSEVGTSGKRKT
jgi:hypothetical protein